MLLTLWKAWAIRPRNVRSRGCNALSPQLGQCSDSTLVLQVGHTQGFAMREL